MKKFCTQCGNKLETGARFCSKCGMALTGEAAGSSTSAPAASSRNLVFTISPFGGFIIALIMGAVVFVFFQIGKSHTASSPGTTAVENLSGSEMTAPASGSAPAALSEPTGDPRVLAIAEKFYCKCGTCDGNDLISTCGCTHPGGAQDVMRFIAAGLEAGMSEATVIAAVNKKYPGYMR
ncbi:MAG: zinc-ribbon domain-containing protein [Candidatus Hydrogenedentota bacterium]